VTVVDLNNDSYSKIDLEAAPQHFALDGSGTLWVSLGSAYGLHAAEKVGLQVINTSTNSKDTFVKVPSLSDDGMLAIDGAGAKIYLLAAQPWPATETNVLEFDTESKALAENALISGENFNGLGYNATTDKLYVADAAGFVGNGKIRVFEEDGVLLDEQVTSIGPFNFMFK
jgi:DNA-binding beta-propeller fold protein YncE